MRSAQPWSPLFRTWPITTSNRSSSSSLSWRTPGQTRAILVAAYGLGEIQGFGAKYEPSQGVSLTVTDQSGNVLASPGGGQTLTSRATDPLVVDALKGRSAVTTVGRPSGRLVSA